MLLDSLDPAIALCNVICLLALPETPLSRFHTNRNQQFAGDLDLQQEKPGRKGRLFDPLWTLA